MFGFDNKAQQTQAGLPASNGPVGVPAVPPMQNGVTPPPMPAADPPIQNEPSADEGMLNDDAPMIPTYQNDSTAPVPSAPTPPPQDVSFDQPHTTAPTEHSDLLALKQEALQQLSPLVDQLEQSPEEKFKTTMMMIQASDDENLIPVAYRAANAIVDEKAKAQALLDIVNEINYFTQQHHQG